MADVFGMGSHGYPVLAFFGPWQAAGLQIGESLIAAGFILLLPFQHLSRSRIASTTDPTR
jgi:hypothetical protein